MAGFYISNFANNSKIVEQDFNHLRYEKMSWGEYNIQRQTLNKFLNDKLFYQDNDSIIITEGVILNKKGLLQQNKFERFESLMKLLWDKDPMELPRISRQGWSGAYFDKRSDKWIVFTNPFGDKPIFYYNKSNRFIVSSSLNYIVSTLRKNNIKYSFYQPAAYDLLTYGWMVDGIGDRTLISEIRRLPAGYALTIKNGRIDCYRYHNFDDIEERQDFTNEDEIIDKLDSLFRNAVRLEYDKDCEYGYKHLTSLSGGLDSRMNLWVANDMGYGDILTETFSQSGTLDETISQKIASDLGVDWIFKSLDSAVFIKDYKSAVFACSGVLTASGVVHGNSLFSKLNPKEYGIMHTGQLGDIVIGAYEPDIYLKSVVPFAKASSTILKDASTSLIDENCYKNCGQFMLYNRAFRGVLSSHFMISNMYEPISPFCDLDFISYCMSLPLYLRVNHNIYKKWILKKYPEAADYVWESTGTKISAGKLKTLMQKIKKAGYRNAIAAGLRKIGIRAKNVRQITANSMNPFEYWYETKSWLRKFIQDEYKKGLDKNIIDGKLKKDIDYMYHCSSCREKIQILSLLAAVQIYFDK